MTLPLSEACRSLVSDRMTEEVGSWYAYNLYEACPNPSARRLEQVATASS